MTRKKCAACKTYFHTENRTRQYCEKCHPGRADSIDKIEKYKQKMDVLFDLKLRIQNHESEQEENKLRIIELGRKISHSPEMKELKQKQEKNRKLGQEINKLNKKLLQSI